MAVAVRYLDRFTSPDGATVVTFPVDLYEWQTSQGLRAAFAPIAGGDYAVDLLGGGVAAKERATERLNIAAYEDSDGAIDTLIDNLKADCYDIGLGKLWTIDRNGSRRWAWARLTAMPGYTITVDTEYRVPVALEFTRNSDWFAETATTVTQAVVASPTEFTVTNTGNAPVQGVVVRFRASGTPGANMVYNPGFEISAEGTNPWSPVNSATLTRDTATKHSGTAALRITGDAATVGQGVSYVRTVSASTAYFLSLWILLVGGEDPVTVEVEEFAGATPKGSHTETIFWANDWQEARIPFVTGATTDSVKIWAVSDGVILANIWIDDIHLGTPAGYHAPTLRNKTTGELFTVSYPAMSANDELRVDSGPRYSCEVSTDDGLSYDEIPGALSIGDAQFNLLTLARGANQLEVTDNGTPDVTIEVEFMSTWH